MWGLFIFCLSLVPKQNSMSKENSITVKIFRTPTFLGGSQSPEVQEYLGEAKVSIGSYFAAGASTTIGSGLSVEEKELLLPEFVGLGITHPDFMKKVEDWYIDIDTKVPHSTGLILEIGLMDNTKALGAKLPDGSLNRPIKPLDFIRYRHAIHHPHVAQTKEIAEGTKKAFYIFNPVEMKRQAAEMAELRDTATELYLEHKKDINKVKMLLVLLGVDLGEFVGKTKEDDMIARLRNMAEAQPKSFIELSNSDDFEAKYTVKELINHGIIKQFGEKIVDPMNKNKILASTYDEFVFYMTDKSKSDMILTLKARLQEKQGDTGVKE